MPVTSALFEVLIEGMIDDAFDELNDAHKDCDFGWFYLQLEGINESDNSYL